MHPRIFNIWARCESQPTTRTTRNSKWTILAPRTVTTIIRCRPIRIKSLTVRLTIGITISYNRCREIITLTIKPIPNSISSSSSQALRTTTTRPTNTITLQVILLSREQISKNRKCWFSLYRRYLVVRSQKMSPSFAHLTIADLNWNHYSRRNLSQIATF